MSALDKVERNLHNVLILLRWVQQVVWAGLGKVIGPGKVIMRLSFRPQTVQNIVTLSV